VIFTHSSSPVIPITGRGDARAFLEDPTADNLQFNTEIALESHYGYLKNLGSSEAERILRSMFESRMLMFYEIRGDDLLEAAIISDEYSLKTNDAAIIANMLRNGVEGIATDNVRDFSRYPGIEVYNPINR